LQSAQSLQPLQSFFSPLQQAQAQSLQSFISPLQQAQAQSAQSLQSFFSALQQAQAHLQSAQQFFFAASAAGSAAAREKLTSAAAIIEARILNMMIVLSSWFRSVCKCNTTGFPICQAKLLKFFSSEAIVSPVAFFRIGDIVRDGDL
jgi:hypothetical protein